MRNDVWESPTNANTSRLVGAGLLAAAGGLLLGGMAALISPLFVAAGLIGLAAMAVLFSSVQAGFLAIILIATLLPFAALPINVGFYPTFLDLALIALLILWLLRLLARPEEPLAGSPVNAPLLVFIGVACVSFVLGTAYSMSRDTIRHFGEIVLALLVYFAVINNVREARHIRLFAQLLIIGGFLASLIGLVLYFLPANTSCQPPGQSAHPALLS